MPISPISKSTPHFLLLYLFRRISQPSGQDQHYHPSPSELTSRIHALKFLWTPKGFISQEDFLNFFANLYATPCLQESFKFMVLRLLENIFLSQKTELFIFTHASKQNFPPGFYYRHSRQKEITHFPRTTFFENLFFPSRKGEDYEAEKMTKIKLAYWSQVLINPTIFLTISLIYAKLKFSSLDFFPMLKGFIFLPY